MALYPLKFEPWFLEKIWGGRKIQSVLGKALPAGKSIGESWEIYDFPPGVPPAGERWISSRVANGALAGRTLHELVVEFGSALLGNVPLAPQGQFPILIKFLDASEDLSVQVHPDERYVAGHGGAFLKNEAWYIVHAERGAELLKGLLPGVKRGQFERAIQDGTVASLIKTIPVRAGDCIYLPSGSVHALKAGIVAAEVQTPSDTTFRVYDFGRIDATTGKPRALHVEQALECIDFSGRPEAPQPSQERSDAVGTTTRMAACDHFVMEQVRASGRREWAIAVGRPAAWIMLEGELAVMVENLSQPTVLRKGDTLLLPAELENPRARTIADSLWLEVTFPKRGGPLR